MTEENVEDTTDKQELNKIYKNAMKYLTDEVDLFTQK